MEWSFLKLLFPKAFTTSGEKVLNPELVEQR